MSRGRFRTLKNPPVLLRFRLVATPCHAYEWPTPSPLLSGQTKADSEKRSGVTEHSPPASPSRVSWLRFDLETPWSWETRRTRELSGRGHRASTAADADTGRGRGPSPED